MYPSFSYPRCWRCLPQQPAVPCWAPLRSSPCMQLRSSLSAPCPPTGSPVTLCQSMCPPSWLPSWQVQLSPPQLCHPYPAPMRVPVSCPHRRPTGTLLPKSPCRPALCHQTHTSLASQWRLLPTLLMLTTQKIFFHLPHMWRPGPAPLLLLPWLCAGPRYQ